jgi:hypothetical protein
MYMLQKETGWTDDYVLWGTSWANLQMKLADAPYFKYGKGGKSGEKVVDQDELIKFLQQQNGG